MPSSFDAFHDETRPLRMLDEQAAPQHTPDSAFTGVVLAVLAVVIPVLVLAAL